MGYEAPHHKRVLDAVSRAPTRFIITTQAHVDHAGGVALFREPGTVYVAQSNNAACQRDDARIPQLRASTAARWFDHDRAYMQKIAAENPGVSTTQDRPTPDLTFDQRLGLRTPRPIRSQQQRGLARWTATRRQICLTFEFAVCRSSIR